MKDIYKFEPSKDLLTFAEDFSKKYKLVNPGCYRSGEFGYGPHSIVYLELNSQSSPKNFDVNIERGYFVFAKDVLVNYSENYVYYMIIWMAIHLDMPREYERTDTHALRHYLKTKLNKNDILKGFNQSVAHQNPLTELNLRRTKYYIETLK